MKIPFENIQIKTYLPQYQRKQLELEHQKGHAIDIVLDLN